jgi:ATP synthase protein I
MSSRTENDDPWLRHGLRTADRGPQQALRPAAPYGTARVTGRGEPAPEPSTPSPHEGWRIFSSMIAGMVFYGGLGWLVGHWTGISILFPMGMILGIVLSIVLIIFRFTRS